jgi:Tfp pilus assembly protein PilO
MSTQKPTASLMYIELGALLAIVSFAVIFYFLLPRLTEANAENAQATAQHEALQKEISTLTSASNTLTQLENQYADQFKAGKLAFPDTEEMPSLYIQLESITGTTPGLVNVSYQAATPVADEKGVKVPVSVTASGRYSDLKNLLNRLEVNSRPLSFTTIVFTQGSGSVANNPEGQSGILTLVASGYARAEALSPAYSPTTGGTQ